MVDIQKKPLGRKCYGHIPHLPGSRMGIGDHSCHDGQKRIATEKTRDKYDEVFVQEKLDGSNVGVARIGGSIYPLIRAGYLATSSPHEMHWHFHEWAMANQSRFVDALEDGERLCGEWLMQAHGTRYNLHHEPFVAFDIMRESDRTTMTSLTERLTRFGFVMPRLLHCGEAFSVESALASIEVSGHGAIDPVEGAIWRVERMNKVDFICKYLRPEKQDGTYLPEISGQPPIYNWQSPFHFPKTTAPTP